MGKEACLVRKPARALEWPQWVRTVTELAQYAVPNGGWSSPGKRTNSAAQRLLAKSSLFLLLIDKLMEEKSNCFHNPYKLPASTA